MSSQGVEQVFLVSLAEEELQTVRSVLAAEEVQPVHLRSLQECGAHVCEEAQALLISEEVLVPEVAEQLASLLAHQPEWSALPVLVLGRPGQAPEKSFRALEMENQLVLFLERPLEAELLRKRLRMALASRRRQHQIRNLMRELAASRQAEQARREEMEVLMETLPAGVWILRDADSLQAHGNRAGCEMLQVPLDVPLKLEPAAAANAPFHFFKEGRELSFSEWPLLRARLSGQPIWGEELRVALPNNATRWILGNAVPLQDKAGQTNGAVAMFVDITEFKQAQAAEARLAALLRSSADAIIGKNLEGIITDWNPAAERLFGWTAQEAIGQSVTMLFPPERLLEEGEVLNRIRNGQSLENLQTVRLTRDGQRLQVLVSVTPVRDECGQVTGASKIVHNITEQKQVERVLQRQNRRLALLNHAAEMLLSEHPDKLLAGVYEPMIHDTQADLFIEYRLDSHGTGLDLEFSGGVPGETLARLRHLELGETVCGTAARLRAPIVVNEVQNSNEPIVQVARQAGVRTFVANPLVVGERLLGTLSFGSRRCDRFEPDELNLFATLANYVALGRERERLVRELQTHSQNLERLVEERTATVRDTMSEMQFLSYSMIHDLRAPLRAMHNFATLLRREAGSQLSETAGDYLERIVTASNRMDLLITEALNYNRVARERPRLEPVDTAALLKGMLQTYLEFQPPRAEVVLAQDLPWVRANAASLTQCFSQVLRNALRFVPADRRPLIRVWAELLPAAEPAGPQRARLWFEDNGVGLSEEQKEQIFHLFEPLQPGRFMRGIGLAVMRKLIERMNGKVGVESVAGQGSRFWIELPAAAVAHSRRVEAARQAA